MEATMSDDHRFAFRKQNWEYLVTKETALLVERRELRQLAGGQ